MVEILKEKESRVALDEISATASPKAGGKRPPTFKSGIELLLEQTGFRRKDTLLGLDVGESAIKFVELNHTQKGWRLLNAGIVEFDFLSDESSEDRSLPRLALNVREALRKFRVKTDKVAVSVSDGRALHRMIIVPRMPEKELRKALSWEVQKYTDLPSEEIWMDYLVRPRSNRGGDFLEILLVVLPRKTGEERISMVKTAGLKCYALETEATALSGGVFNLAPHLSNQTFALLDMGLKTSVLNIFQEGFLYFTRNIEWGGQNLTRALSEKMGYEFKRAENLKKEKGLLESEWEGADLEKGKRVLEVEIDNLVEEMDKSLQYYHVQFPEEKVEQLLLTGGTSLLPGLQVFLQKRLGMKVGRFDPLDSLIFDESPESEGYLRQMSARLSVALGLGTWRRG